MELAIQHFFSVGNGYWFLRQCTLEFHYIGTMLTSRSPFWLEPAFQTDPVWIILFIADNHRYLWMARTVWHEQQPVRAFALV